MGREWEWVMNGILTGRYGGDGSQGSSPVHHTLTRLFRLSKIFVLKGDFDKHGKYFDLGCCVPSEAEFICKIKDDVRMFIGVICT
jgi:hypothetical protein